MLIIARVEATTLERPIKKRTLVVRFSLNYNWLVGV
jgi:hypothetical protein